MGKRTWRQVDRQWQCPPSPSFHRPLRILLRSVQNNKKEKHPSSPTHTHTSTTTLLTPYLTTYLKTDHNNHSLCLHDGHGSLGYTEHPLHANHRPTCPTGPSRPRGNTTEVSLAPFDGLGSERPARCPPEAHRSSYHCFHTSHRGHFHFPPKSEHHTLAKCSLSARLLRNHREILSSVSHGHTTSTTYSINVSRKKD